MSKHHFTRHVTATAMKELKAQIEIKYPNSKQLMEYYSKNKEKQKWENFKEKLLTGYMAEMDMEKSRVRNFGQVMLRRDSTSSQKRTINSAGGGWKK